MNNYNSKELLNYKVPDNLMDRFQNIMVFTKNMVLKDSKFFENYEDEISAWFGKMLIKYFDSELSNNDIIELLYFVWQYNKIVDSQLLSADIPFKVKTIYGLVGLDDIADITASSLVNTTDPKNLPASLITKISTLSSYDGSFLKMICNYFLSENENTNSTYTKDSVLREAYLILIRRGSLVYDTDLESENPTGFVTFLNTKKRQIETLEEAFKNRLKIQITSVKSSETERYDKRSASTNERSLAESGEPLVFFDIKLVGESITSNNPDVLSMINEYSTAPLEIFKNTTNNVNTPDTVNFQILYKELNLAYRETTGSDILDLCAALEWINIEGSLLEKKNSITNRPMIIVREIQDNIYIRDIVENGEVISTNKLYKYRRTNPYICRRAAESDLIVYYSGDNYISNNYGTYAYHKSEISLFREIYKETREYFYTVLLNEAFTNEEEYSFYEKYFITFLSIVRFMDAKLDTVRDIESFSKDDIENFLVSFGLGSLATILDISVFTNSESYSKSLIRRYIELMQSKGSRKVIDILQETFSINSTELVIYKNIIVGDNSDNENPYNVYKFIKVPYESVSQMEIIQNNISAAQTLEAATSQDKYWDKNDTTDKLLTELDVNVANTKYIIPEITNEFSEAYTTTRVLFELVDFLSRNLSASNRISISNEVMDNGTILEYVNSIRYLWYRYLILLDISIDDVILPIAGSTKKTFIHIEDKNDTNAAIISVPIGYEDNLDYDILCRLRDVLEPEGSTTLNLSKMFEIVNTGKDTGNTIKLKDIAKDVISSGHHINNTILGNIYSFLEAMAPLFIAIGDSGESIEENITTLYNRLTSVDNNVLEGKDISGIIISSFIPSIINQSLITAINKGTIYNYNLPAPILHFIMFIYYNTFFGSNYNGPLIIEDTAISGANWTSGSYRDYMTDIANQSNLYKFKGDICNLSDADSIKAGIITACNELSEACSVLVNLNLSSRDDLMITFLRTAIEYFISYTTEIYQFVFRNSFKSYSEASTVSDNWKSNVHYKEIDSLYYDEQLTITKQSS